MQILNAKLISLMYLADIFFVYFVWKEQIIGYFTWKNKNISVIIKEIMNENLKQYLEFIADFEDIQTETYLTLLKNAAGKKEQARKRILANVEDIDEAMRDARKYLRITDYLLDRWDREREKNKFGIA